MPGTYRWAVYLAKTVTILDLGTGVLSEATVWTDGTHIRFAKRIQLESPIWIEGLRVKVE